MSMTPERIEEIKQLISKHKHFEKRLKTTKNYNEADSSVIRLDHIESRAFGFIPELLAALEESQQPYTHMEPIHLAALSRVEVIRILRKLERELVEAQQTIARQREALESARNTMEDALSVGEARYKDFDTRLCPWADLSDGVENIEAALGNKEGSDKA